MLRRAKRDTTRPYTHRVTRDHGGGLWSLEDDSGQTYLAVLSPTSDLVRKRIENERRAQGLTTYFK